MEKQVLVCLTEGESADGCLNTDGLNTTLTVYSFGQSFEYLSGAVISNYPSQSDTDYL